MNMYCQTQLYSCRTTDRLTSLTIDSNSHFYRYIMNAMHWLDWPRDTHADRRDWLIDWLPRNHAPRQQQQTFKTRLHIQQLCLSSPVQYFVIFDARQCHSRSCAFSAPAGAWSVSDNWLSCCAFYILSKLEQLCHTVKHVDVCCLCMSCGCCN